MADGDITLSNNPNVDTAFVEKDGVKLRATLQEIPAGTLVLSDSPNVDTGYVIDEDGKKHRVHLVATPDGTLETSDNVNSGKGYITDENGKKHRVDLVASLSGGGVEPTGTLTITQNGIYDVAEYASADVQTSVPSAYTEYVISGGSVSKQGVLPDFTSLTNGWTTGDFPYAFYGCTNITTTPDLSNVSNNIYFDHTFGNCSNMAGEIVFNQTGTIGSNINCGYAFQNCAKITKVKFGAMSNVPGSAFANCFNGCTGLIEVEAKKPITLASTQCFSYCFRYCTGLKKADLSGINSNQGSMLNYAFDGCTALETVDLSGLTALTGYNAIACCFQNCSSLTYVNMKNTTSITNGTNLLFCGCTSLRKQKFESLTSIVNGNDVFGLCQNLHVYFYALTTLPSSSYDSFMGREQGSVHTRAVDCTLHFPIAMQSTVSGINFGGTNTTVVCDLVQTITCADGNTYNRQEKSSTDTATAWIRSGVLYYTSGNTEPAVNDTLYSDEGCTTALTTITAIA